MYETTSRGRFFSEENMACKHAKNAKAREYRAATRDKINSRLRERWATDPAYRERITKRQRAAYWARKARA